MNYCDIKRCNRIAYKCKIEDCICRIESNEHIFTQRRVTPMLPQDPMILLSYLNTKLRDFYPTLDALCDDLQIDGGEVSRRLAAIDCRYSPERNQFVSC